VAPLHMCNVIGKFSSNGTRAEIRRPEIRFALMCQWTQGNLPVRRTDVIKWHRGPLHQKFQI